jgi:hypothetical protein
MLASAAKVAQQQWLLVGLQCAFAEDREAAAAAWLVETSISQQCE